MEEGLAVAFALLVGHLSANRVHLFVHPSVVAGHHQQTVAQVHAFPFSSRSYRSTASFTSCPRPSQCVKAIGRQGPKAVKAWTSDSRRSAIIRRCNAETSSLARTLRSEEH